MENKLFSPVLSAANNIVKTKRPLTRTSKDYNDFVKWLDASNKDLKKVKLPTKKKVETLASGLSLDIAASGGGGGIDLLGSLLGGAGALGAGLGLRKLFKGKFGGGKFKGNFEDIIKNIKKKGNLTKGEKFSLRDYKRLVGKGGISNESAAFNALHRNSRNWYRGENVMGGGFSAETATQYRQAGRSGGGGFKGAPRGRLGGIAGPLNIAFAGLDFMGRKGEGQSNLQAGVGAAGGALGGLAGAEAGAAAGAAIGALFGGVGAVPGAIIGGLIGGFGGGQLGGNLADKLTGADKMDERLKAQEKKQKEAASKRVTFSDVINKFDKVVSKFEKLKFGMTGVKNKNDSNSQIEDSDSIEPTNPIDTGNNAESTGLQLEDVEASGGEVPGSPDSGFRSAHRPKHNGNDYFKNVGTPISLIQEGTVTVADMNYDPGGWGALVEVRHKDGSLSRYAHLSKISVAAGSKISPGQVIGYSGGAAGASGAGNSEGPHLHFEYLPSGSGQVDPTEAAKRIFRFGGNVKVKAKKGSDQQTPAVPVNTITKQQSIEDFIKGTKSGDKILKDPKLKAQLLGEKYQFKNAMVKTPVTDPEVKQTLTMYNAYVRDMRSRQKARASATPPAIPQALMDDSSVAGSTTMILQQPSVAPADGTGQATMIPVPMGGGGGDTFISGPSEGQIVNSLLKAFLLTNLSGT